MCMLLRATNGRKDKNENQNCVIDELSSCDNSNVLELKLKYTNARVGQLKNVSSIHGVLSCSTCRNQKKPMPRPCLDFRG